MMKIENVFSRNVLICLLLLVSQNAISQQNFIPGYIISLNGDTLRGYIDYRNWNKNPDKVIFREFSGNKAAIYLPNEILAFGIKDEYYVSATVSIETSPRNTDGLNYDKAVHLQTVTTFLQAMITGKKSLYHGFYSARDYFYIKQDSTYDLLLYKMYLTGQGDNSMMNENKAYLGQLNYYLGDCPEIEDRLKKTDYKLQDLLSLFEYYYEQTNSLVSFKREVEKLRAETGLLAGGTLTSLVFSGPSYFTQTDFNLSVNFTAGLYCDLIIPRNQGKWSFNNELILTSYNVSGTYTEGTENQYTTTTTELGYTYLKINTLVRFKYPVGQTYIFLNGGLSNGFVVKETNHETVFTKFYTSETTEEGIAIDDSRKYELGFLVGGGLKAGRYSAEARYERGNGMSRIYTITGKTNRIYLLLGFRF
jgi:hypothetical protein